MSYEIVKKVVIKKGKTISITRERKFSQRKRKFSKRII